MGALGFVGVANCVCIKVASVGGCGLFVVRNGLVALAGGFVLVLARGGSFKRWLVEVVESRVIEESVVARLLSCRRVIGSDCRF